MGLTGEIKKKKKERKNSKKSFIVKESLNS